MILLRFIVRLLGFVLLVVLALLGGVVAIFSIEGGDTGLSIPALADLVSLPELGRTIDDFRAQLEANGPVATLSALGGLAAIVLGVVLIIGALLPTRERVLTLDDSEAGRLAARRRPLAQYATTLAERVDGVTNARVRAKPGRFRPRHPQGPRRPDTSDQAARALPANRRGPRARHPCLRSAQPDQH